MSNIYYEDIFITEKKGLYKLARSKNLFPPEKDFYNNYYLLATSQMIVSRDIAFMISREEYDKIIETNFDEKYITNVINKQSHFANVIHKPQKELDEMLNDDNQNTEEKENNYTK